MYLVSSEYTKLKRLALKLWTLRYECGRFFSLSIFLLPCTGYCHRFPWHSQGIAAVLWVRLLFKWDKLSCVCVCRQQHNKWINLPNLMFLIFTFWPVLNVNNRDYFIKQGARMCSMWGTFCLIFLGICLWGINGDQMM